MPTLVDTACETYPAAAQESRVMTSTLTIESLPLLPEGWSYEPHAFDDQVVHIRWREHGAVSVHFKRRTIDIGWVIPGPAPRHATLPSGKAWKVKLIGDAVKMLKAPWD